jgi:hypothetical protein
MTIAEKKAPKKKRKSSFLKSSRKCTTTSSKRSATKAKSGSKKRRTLFTAKSNEEEEEEVSTEELADEEIEDLPDLKGRSLDLTEQPQWLLSLVSGFLAHDPSGSQSTCLWAIVSASDIRRGQRQLIRAGMVCSSWRDAFMGCRAGWNTLALRALPANVSFNNPVFECSK